MNPLSAIRECVRYITYPFRLLARLPASIISAPGRFLGMSLPTRVAVVIGFCLLVVSILGLIIHASRRDSPDWVQFAGVALALLLCVVAIALIIRQLVRLWLEKDSSQFPEIDAAWDAGIAALREKGIDFVDTPVFLLVGAGSKSEADALFHASGLSLSVAGVLPEKGWLHWYATSDAIYLVATKTCRLGAVKGKLTDSGDKLDHGSDLIRQTINPDRDIRGTAEAMRDADVSRLGRPQEGRGPVDAASEPSLRGTMIVMVNSESASGGGASPAGRGAPHLSIDEGTENSHRLAYVCQKLRRERQPVCPCNGIVALLPFEIIRRGPGEAVEVQRAAKADLDMIRQQLALRCPVIALVGGMEREPGFRELVRRVGVKRAKGQRFGCGFNVWNPPIPDQIEALAAHACKSFEDFTYELFKEKDGLTQYGNRKLYSLLCCVRSTLRVRLTNTLVAAFAEETTEPYGSGEALLFSGCYFAATGDVDDRQAFVRGVIADKLSDQEGELEWSRRALKEDQRFHQLAQGILLLDGLLFLATLGIGWLLLSRWVSG